MNWVLWTLQSLTACVFVYSGVNKSVLSEKQLVAKGQTGVEGLSLPVIRFIGITEILGAIALILPRLIHTLPILTPIAALCLALIMVPAGIIHYNRGEYKNIITNVVLFLMSMFIAYGRMFLAP